MFFRLFAITNVVAFVVVRDLPIAHLSALLQLNAARKYANNTGQHSHKHCLLGMFVNQLFYKSKYMYIIVVFPVAK